MAEQVYLPLPWLLQIPGRGVRIWKFIAAPVVARIKAKSRYLYKYRPFCSGVSDSDTDRLALRQNHFIDDVNHAIVGFDVGLDNIGAIHGYAGHAVYANFRTFNCGDAQLLAAYVG